MTNELSIPTQVPGAPLASRDVYREVLANSGEAVAIIDLSGRYLEQNASHCELIGYSDKELIGKTPAIHLGRRTFQMIAAELRRSGKFTGEVISRTRNGRRLDVEINAFAIVDARGDHLCYVGIKRDISERKRTERELRRQYQQLQALYRLTDAVGRADRVEEIYEEALCGLQAAIGVTRSSILLFDPEGVMRFKASRGISPAYQARVEGHSPWRADTRDPQPITIADVRRHASMGPLRETILEEGIRALAFVPLITQGRLLGKFMVYYDTPHHFEPSEIQLAQSIANQVALAIARKRDEDERRFQQALLAAQMEASVEGILVVSPQGKMISFNQRFVDLWGLPPEVVQSRSDQAALQVVCEKILDPKAFLARVDHLYEHPTESSRDVLHLKDGRVYDRYSAPLPSSGWGNQGRIWFFRDITESRRAEEVQRLLAEAGRILSSSLEAEPTLASLARLAVPHLGDLCVVHLVDSDGTLHRVAVAHSDPRSEQVALEALSPSIHAVAAADPIVRCVRGGTTLFLPSLAEDHPAGEADGPEHSVLTRHMGLSSGLIVPMKSRDGVRGTLSFFASGAHRRITPEDRIVAEELARRAALAVENATLYAAALEANRAKSDFLAVMSHELRTPLNGILGYTDLLLLGVPVPLPEPARAHVERIGVSGRHLLQIIEEILTFSRLEAGKEEIHPVRFDVAELAEETAALVQPLAAQKGLAFDLAVGREPVWIETDPGRVRQILLNLLSNSIKFTESGVVRLSLRVQQSGVLLGVQDSGIGLTPVQLERVFEPFWQADHSPTRRAGGAGLGLSVTRRLTELLGGTIRVESRLGQGTLFTVVLPADPESKPAPDPEPRISAAER